MISFDKTHNNRPSLWGRPASPHPALRGSLGWLAAALMSFQLQAAPEPITTDFPDDQVLAVLPEATPSETWRKDTAEETARRLENLIGQARSSGDPRYLGYAEALIAHWPDEELTDRLRVLRATLQQSLHRFDVARSELLHVLSASTDRRQRVQARLTLANLELVQGNYRNAKIHCDALNADYPGLIAQSCQALVAARTGKPERAYKRLTSQLADRRGNGNLDTTSWLWTEGTLGDIAAQTGLANARMHWQTVLAEDPDDLYIRAQLADWHLQHNQPEQALLLTQGYEAVDPLAVIRAIAMKRLDHPGSEALNLQLRQRFEEAEWRGAMLHARDFARFLLDVEGQPTEALYWAAENWQSQREPLDTRLLLRSALAAQDPGQSRAVTDWLTSQGQQDARYPELQK